MEDNMNKLREYAKYSFDAEEMVKDCEQTNINGIKSYQIGFILLNLVVILLFLIYF